jgi:hypothetical protein
VKSEITNNGVENLVICLQGIKIYDEMRSVLSFLGYFRNWPIPPSVHALLRGLVGATVSNNGAIQLVYYYLGGVLDRGRVTDSPSLSLSLLTNGLTLWLQVVRGPVIRLCGKTMQSQQQ